jgi:hypothetical protein
MLHPDVPRWHPAQPAALWNVLQDEGLLAADCQAAEAAGCFAGEQFLQLIHFLGCSPKVALTVADATHGTPLCKVRFNQFEDVRFVAAQRRSPPRCPHCRSQAAINEPTVDEVYHCPDCHRHTPVHRLDWRQAAGFGRFFIEVSGIYPHEAVPAERLLQRLRDFSQGDWKYFYVV